MADLEGLYNQLDAEAGASTRPTGQACWNRSLALPLIEAWLQVHDQTRDAALVELKAENERLRAESRRLAAIREAFAFYENEDPSMVEFIRSVRSILRAECDHCGLPVEGHSDSTAGPLTVCPPPSLVGEVKADG